MTERDVLFMTMQARLPEGWHLEGQMLMVGGGLWAAYASRDGRFRRGLGGDVFEAAEVLVRDFDSLPEYTDWSEGRWL